MKRLLPCLLLVFFGAAQASAAIRPGTDPLAYDGPAWSPYLVGAGIGVLSWFTFYFSNKSIGASSFYATLAGLLGKLAAPRFTRNLPYFRDNPPRINWALVFLGCAILGSFLAAWTGGELTGRWLPPMWEARFGDSLALRAAVAAFGGLLMAFGARLAGGCTSGHGISGTLQLNPGSWLVVACMFTGGIVTAMFLYRA